MSAKNLKISKMQKEENTEIYILKLFFKVPVLVAGSEGVPSGNGNGILCCGRAL